MKQKCIIFISFLLLSNLSLHAQKDTKGTDFWLTFGKQCCVLDKTLNLQIRIVAGNQAAAGIIYFTHLNDTVFFSVAAWGIFTYNLTPAQIQAVYNETQGISDYSVRITTDNPVAVYALNQVVASADATNILPVTALGTEYYHISYHIFFFFNNAYALVATQNNTRIYHNGLWLGTLNRGEVFYMPSSTDMTGCPITADNPVAVFAVHPGVNIPQYYGAADILFQQLAPVHSWGNNFFVPVSRRVRDFVRIVASQNGTSISQKGAVRIVTGNGGQPSLTNLRAGQWVELETSLDSNGCYIQANKPVGVCTYLAGLSYNRGIIYNGDTLDGLTSDPAQAWLPAIEQKISSALVAPFIPTEITALNAHYALIITPTATKDSTIVKIGNNAEQSLSGGIWHNHSAGYSFYDMPLTDDTSAYLFTNTVGKLIVMGYGMGQAESYYYLLASAMRKLAYFDVNGIHYLQFDGKVICNENIEVAATIRFQMDTARGHLRWLIDEVEQTAFTDSLHWTTKLSIGKHSILMIVKDEDGEADSLLTSFVIQKEFTTIYDTVCLGDSILFNGQYYYQTGIYTDTLHTIFDCDSIVTLHLLVNNTSDTTIYDTICVVDLPYQSHGFNVFVGGFYSRVIKNSVGCDSTITLYLTVNDTAMQEIIANICEGEAYTEHDFNETKTGIYTKILRTDFGCDSTLILNLTVNPKPNIEIVVLSNNLCEKDVALLQVVTNADSLLWSTGDTMRNIAVSATGLYSVSAMLGDCKAYQEQEIEIICPCSLFLPNFFSPNGDGINDEYIPQVTEELNSFSMVIYSRWGNVVFRTEEFRAWDGKHNGRDASAGVYFCVVEYTCKYNPTKKRFAQSSITLMR